MELLAAMVIFSLFAGIIWGFLFQSLKLNDAEVTKQQLKTEANLILNTIQNVHIKEETYEIITNTDQSALHVNELTFETPGIKYEIIEFSPSANWNNVHVKIMLSSSEESNIKYEINTTFNRIR